jgi:hypothetical protein
MARCHVDLQSAGSKTLFDQLITQRQYFRVFDIAIGLNLLADVGKGLRFQVGILSNFVSGIIGVGCVNDTSFDVCAFAFSKGVQRHRRSNSPSLTLGLARVWQKPLLQPAHRGARRGQNQFLTTDDADPTDSR